VARNYYCRKFREWLKFRYRPLNASGEEMRRIVLDDLRFPRSTNRIERVVDYAMTMRMSHDIDREFGHAIYRYMMYKNLMYREHCLRGDVRLKSSKGLRLGD